jgi:phosphate transport system substrate-binding protein
MPHNNKVTSFVLAFIVTVGLGSSGLALIQKFYQDPKHTPQHDNKRTQLQHSTKSEKVDQGKLPRGDFNYGGSSSWAAINAVAEPAIQTASPGFHLHYLLPIGEPPSSDAGIKMLIDGKLNFAESSRPISDQENKQAQQRGFKLEQIAVAMDGVAVAVNPKLNITGLTIDQLKSIYSGKITNWKQLGGPNLAIKPYSPPRNNDGTVELFEKNIMSGKSFGSNVKILPTTAQALKKLVDDPAGIYYAYASEVVQQCNVKSLPLGREPGKFVPPYQEPLVPPSQCSGKHNQLNQAAFENDQYPITSLLYVIVKQNRQIDQKVGQAYAQFILSNQGQELVNQAGFSKMR